MTISDNQTSLKPVWDAILAVYIEFAKICERHHLRFYLTDGSAIGAIRHHGFIPWDDDLDVSMPREDYDEFMRVAPQELPPYLCTLSIDKTPGYCNLHGKVQDTRRDVIERVESDVGYTLSSGIFIDIFPIDGWSGSKFLVNVNKMRFFLLTCACKFQQNKIMGLSWRGVIAWMLGAALRPFYGDLSEKKNASLAYQSVYGVRSCRDMPYTARVRCWHDRRLILRADIWGIPKYVDFCGLKVPVPEKYDSYLRQDYGNYMSLPPVEKRKSTHNTDGVHFPFWLGPTKEGSCSA